MFFFGGQILSILNLNFKKLYTIEDIFNEKWLKLLDLYNKL
jgi:hypothetical protein